MASDVFFCFFVYVYFFCSGEQNKTSENDYNWSFEFPICIFSFFFFSGEAKNTLRMAEIA